MRVRLIAPLDGVQQENADGIWVNCPPEPLYSGPRKVCRCGRRFWTCEGYRGHFALIHILRLEGGGK